ncbi:MAG: carbohydrate-binding family 9-like protein [Myxococcales bacterium]|nr:carbohydrate-binding family 9-like protein [Myxococcales bacterium]
MTRSLARFSSVCLALFALASSCKRGTVEPGEGSEPVRIRSDGRLPSLDAKRVRPGQITVDGIMNEPVWREAGTTGALVHPGTGRPEPRSRVNGAVRFLWDEQHLYVAANIYDSDPQTPFDPSETDPHLWERASAVELMIQPGDHGDNQQYFELQVDPRGARWETRFDDYNRPITTAPNGQRMFGHQEWRTNMQTRAVISRGRRYVIEMAIPWRDFETQGRATVPPRAGDVWRMNVYSFRDGQSDSLAWSPTLGQGNFHFAPRFGRLVLAN